jgi:transcriptional regulator with XRE-family HTH domain
MPDKRGHFDAMGFYQALDATRRARQITWRQVAREAGVTASTLTRMAQRKRPDVDSLAALTAWSGLRADDFVRSDEKEPTAEPLAMISTYLRSDPTLSAEAAEALDELVKATYQRLRKTT